MITKAQYEEYMDQSTLELAAALKTQAEMRECITELIVELKKYKSLPSYDGKYVDEKIKNARKFTNPTLFTQAKQGDQNEQER
jgi:hypothetical protein